MPPLNRCRQSVARRCYANRRHSRLLRQNTESSRAALSQRRVHAGRGPIRSTQRGLQQSRVGNAFRACGFEEGSRRSPTSYTAILGLGMSALVPGTRGFAARTVKAGAGVGRTLPLSALPSQLFPLFGALRILSRFGAMHLFLRTATVMVPRASGVRVLVARCRNAGCLDTIECHPEALTV